MRTHVIAATALLSSCLIGEHPGFAGDASAETSSTATGSTDSGTDTTGTGSTETNGTDSTDGTDTTETTDGTDATDETGGPQVHRIFVTSSVYTGDFGGLAGADAICQQHSENAGLGGTWMAVMSAGDENVKDRLTVDLPVVNMIGEPVATDAADLWDMMLDNPVLYDEWEAARVSDVWTGTGIDGLAGGIDCDLWTTQMASGFRGRSDVADDGWLWQGFRFCSLGLPLYCISQ